MSIASQARIIRHRTADPFARIPTTLLEDCSISWKAKGLLCYLLGKPDDWMPMVNDILNRGIDGETAVRTGLRELRESGYAQLQRIIGQDGTVLSFQLVISDKKEFPPSTVIMNFNSSAKHPDVENPDLGSKPDPSKPDVENPDLENPHLSKTEETKNELTKNDNADFDAKSIYEEYPRKVDKQAALKAIKKALKNHPKEFLIERTKAYAAARSGQDEQFTPYPATWFNKGRFNDDPSAWKPTNGHATNQRPTAPHRNDFMYK